MDKMLSALRFWLLLVTYKRSAALVTEFTASSGRSGLRLMIVGLGRVGSDCAEIALGHFDAVYGTVRSMDKVQPEGGDGITRIPFHANSICPLLSELTHMLITVPRPKEPDDNLDLILREIQAGIPSKSWIGLISTTGVYGNHDGTWVTEDSPLLCAQGSNAFLYTAYEQLWEKWAATRDQQLAIFRCAGIYDSSRSALHTIFRDGYSSSSVSPRDDVTNRIHSKDIARAVLASMLKVKSPHQTRVYNLADNLPESRSTVLAYAADLLRGKGVPIKEQNRASDSLSVRGRRRLEDRKMVSNMRMQEELLPDGLLFPTYREGLKAILEDRTTPWHHL